MKESIKSIIEWHEKTFPDATLDGQEEKFYHEQSEFMRADTREDLIYECADCYIVACGIARFSLFKASMFFKAVSSMISVQGLSETEIEEAINKKMEKNRRRVWEKQNGMYQHKAGIED